MLKQYLREAIDDLERLDELTRQDIEDVKLASHEAMFERIGEKERLIASFEKKKGRIDAHIAAMVRNAENADLEVLLDRQTKQMLATMREKLERLQSNNRRFARLVIAVGEFYDSLYEEILPVEREGYHGRSRKAASLMEVRV